MARSASLRRQRLLQWTVVGSVQFVVLTLVAMFLYPGGTVADPTTRGYSFFSNFFSELGFTQTRLGKPNTASAVLFFVALTLAGLAMILFFATMPAFFHHHSLGRVLSRLGSIAGIISGLCFIGVAFAPANLYLGPHALFVQGAFLSFFLATLLYLAAILVTPSYPNAQAAVFAVFAALLAGYLWLLFFGPHAATPGGLLIQATGQKIIVYAAVLSVLIAAGGARRVASDQERPEITPPDPDRR